MNEQVGAPCSQHELMPLIFSCHLPLWSCASPWHLVMGLLLAAHVNLSVNEILQRYERDIAQMLDDISKTREQVMDHESSGVCESTSCSQSQLRGSDTLKQCRLLASSGYAVSSLSSGL
jgi:hypothetical protein